MTSFLALEPIKKNLNPMGFSKHVSLGDILGSGWNSLLIFPPFFAGAATASAIHRLGHFFISPKSTDFEKIKSLAVRAVAFIVGCNVGFYVAGRMSLIPFSAEKALRIATLAVTAPGASLGWYGTRSLCVIGAVGALFGTFYDKFPQGRLNR